MSAMGEDFIAGGDFFGAIMAGFLLGLGGDYLFGTRPVLVVSGIIADRDLFPWSSPVAGSYRFPIESLSNRPWSSLREPWTCLPRSW